MSTIHSKRTASVDEIAAEMDRRGAVIETLEAKVQRLEMALEEIDAVAVDFGYFESAARTMKAIVTRVLNDQS